MCVWVCDKERNAWREGSALYVRHRGMVRGFKSLHRQPHEAFHRRQRLPCFSVRTEQAHLLSRHCEMCVCVLSLHTHVLISSRYVWEKSSSVIDVSASPRLRQDPDGTLHISQTWSGDIGTYTCRVTSVGGNDSRSAHLRVRSAYLPPLSEIFSLEDVMDGCFLHCCGLLLLLSPMHPAL